MVFVWRERSCACFELLNYYKTNLQLCRFHQEYSSSLKIRHMLEPMSSCVKECVDDNYMLNICGFQCAALAMDISFICLYLLKKMGMGIVSVIVSLMFAFPLPRMCFFGRIGWFVTEWITQKYWMNFHQNVVEDKCWPRKAPIRFCVEWDKWTDPECFLPQKGADTWIFV